MSINRKLPKLTIKRCTKIGCIPLAMHALTKFEHFVSITSSVTLLKYLAKGKHIAFKHCVFLPALLDVSLTTYKAQRPPPTFRIGSSQFAPRPIAEAWLVRLINLCEHKPACLIPGFGCPSSSDPAGSLTPYRDF